MYLSRKIACLNQIDFFLPLSSSFFPTLLFIKSIKCNNVEAVFRSFALFFSSFLIAFHYHVKNVMTVTFSGRTCLLFSG